MSGVLSRGGVTEAKIKPKIRTSCGSAALVQNMSKFYICKSYVQRKLSKSTRSRFQSTVGGCELPFAVVTF